MDDLLVHSLVKDHNEYNFRHAQSTHRAWSKTFTQEMPVLQG